MRGTSLPDSRRLCGHCPERRGGQIGQVSRRTRQQAHHLNGPIRRHQQLPLARAHAERPARSLSPSGLQLLSRERA